MNHRKYAVPSPLRLPYSIPMDFRLDIVEARVLGCLIEKERTTPEYYPLTLNALTAACNQKNNREPEMHLAGAVVEKAIDTLRLKNLVFLSHTAGGRTPKYAHQLEKFVSFTPPEIAILCLLLLRGPQTSGELRSRAERIYAFSGPAEVDGALQELATRSDGPFVVKLARQPGQSAVRYAQLLSGPIDSDVASAAPAEPPTPSPDRLTVLAGEVAALRAELNDLKRQLGLIPESGAQDNLPRVAE